MTDFITIADTPVASAMKYKPSDWLGVRCSTQAEADERVPELLRQDARRFVLLTPRGAMDIRDYLKDPWMPDRIVKPGSVPIEHIEVRGIGFVIVQGGDTPHVEPIRQQCEAAGVEFILCE